MNWDRMGHKDLKNLGDLELKFLDVVTKTFMHSFFNP